MPSHLRNLDLSLSDFRQLLKTALFQTVPVLLPLTARAFVTVNLLIERFEMSVYYFFAHQHKAAGVKTKQNVKQRLQRL